MRRTHRTRSIVASSWNSPDTPRNTAGLQTWAAHCSGSAASRIEPHGRHVLPVGGNPAFKRSDFFHRLTANFSSFEANLYPRFRAHSPRGKYVDRKTLPSMGLPSHRRRHCGCRSGRGPEHSVPVLSKVGQVTVRCQAGGVRHEVDTALALNPRGTPEKRYAKPTPLAFVNDCCPHFVSDFVGRQLFCRRIHAGSVHCHVRLIAVGGVGVSIRANLARSA